MVCNDTLIGDERTGKNRGIVFPRVCGGRRRAEVANEESMRHTHIAHKFDPIGSLLSKAYGSGVVLSCSIFIAIDLAHISHAACARMSSDL